MTERLILLLLVLLRIILPCVRGCDGDRFYSVPCLPHVRRASSLLPSTCQLDVPTQGSLAPLPVDAAPPDQLFPSAMRTGPDLCLCFLPLFSTLLQLLSGRMLSIRATRTGRQRCRPLMKPPPVEAEDAH